MRRTKEEAMRTRRSIMESALDIFSEKNFANASVSEITSRIGLSKGAFYWHFKNKQDILVKIVEEFCAGDCTDTMGGICGASQEAGCCTMRKYLKDVLVRLRSEERWKKLHELMIRRHEWPDDIRERVEQILQESMLRDIKKMEAYVEERQKTGQIRKSVSAHKVAVLMVSIFHGLGIAQLSGALPDEFTDCADILFDALGKELSVKPEA